MLTALRIKNLALVADLTLELQPGCIVITGETGAGKSILIGALNLVLGERADRSLIRSGADSCSVEAVFDLSRDRRREEADSATTGQSASSRRRRHSEVENLLEENGLEPCEGHQLVLKRTFTNTGTNRQFVNGSPTTLAILARLGEELVDLHGPHDHQSLLQPARQLAVLDAFGGLAADREAFGELVRGRAALAAEKSALIVDERTYAQQLDRLRFQVKEIETAHLQPDEEEHTTEEHHRASNAARLLQLCQTALDQLAENDAAVLTQTGLLGRTLQELHRVDAGADRLTQLHEQAGAVLRELQAELSRYADRVDVDPARLAELEERLNLIHSLKRKYGATLAEVLAAGEEAKRNLHSLEGRDAELARLNAALEKLDAEIRRAGQALSAKRRKVIPQLAKAAAKQLADLGFKQSKFEVAIETARWGEAADEPPLARQSTAAAARADARPSSSGFDQIEFQFSPNVGEPLKPLRAIASSGEMARVMLALKTVLAAEDEIPVLVFDEVDANVGGETANAVGEKMKQIAARRQVLCITHLPQVAAPADAHYVVTKEVRAGRTLTEISRLDRPARITELARMLGGQSDAARRHAAALLK